MIASDASAFADLMPWLALFIGAGVVALTDWWFVVHGPRERRWVTKPLVMVLLIASVLSESSSRDIGSGTRTLIIIGLGLSLIGDIALLDDRWFVIGLGAFLLGHIAFIGAAFGVGVSARPLGIALIAVAIAAAAVGVKVLRGAAAKDPKLGKPVLFYIGVISLMVAACVATSEPWLIVAAALFYVSDLVLGWNRFVTPTTWAPPTVMVTYHLAQAAFAFFAVSGVV